MTLTMPRVNTAALNRFYHLVKQNEDQHTMEKVVELYEKYIKNEKVITFAGHFSAGKSSLINQLLQEDILPQSPIPTSANIVKISSGSGAADVYLTDGKILRYEAPYDIDMIKNFCMDKTNIRQIELTTSKSILPESLTFMDTPGIDASDDKDRELTEASLHLTDVLFYVMDYNHVQSEINLHFLRQLKTYKIPFYIVVNQIDKHQAKEISFTDYQALVHQTFTDWELKPLKTFFISLKDFSLPNNEFERLSETIFQLEQTSFVDYSRSFSHLMKQHEQFIQSTYEEKKQKLIISHEEKEAYKQTKSLKSSLLQAEKQVLTLKKSLEKELNHSLNNAYLMPFEIREYARKFLESYEANFKVGFFSSQRKIEVERDKRLQKFYKATVETIDASLTWNLREKLQGIVESFAINDVNIQAAIQSLSITFTKDDLRNLMHPSVTVNGQYVLHYTEQVANLIKHKFKQSLELLWKDIESFMNEQIEHKQVAYQSLRSLAKSYEQKQKDIQQLERTIQNQIRKLSTVVNVREAVDDQLGKIYKSQRIYDTSEMPALDFLEDVTIPQKKNEVEALKEVDSTKPLKDQNIITKIEKTINIMNDLPSFSSIVKDLIKQKERLENRQVTVALFGAFSAGKSTFLNALIGEALLPTAPNPMTAAITKIHPVTNNHPHGTIIVHFKKEKQIIHDLQEMLQDFTLQDCSLEQHVKQLHEKNTFQEAMLDETRRTYIASILSGFSKMQSCIGKKKTIALKTFHELVTDENQACFVDSIDIYYSFELTDRKITLVDTPGADSIHARHTDVAFNYMKHADVLIYITYYNHAFTKADREFITQLGRVKETFELDKMFFIVNAADLAKDHQELQLVTNHVEEELQRLGVRLANIYPLSSKRSLLEKIEGRTINKQMQTFLQSFDRFIEKDLTKLIVNAITVDLQRVKQLLNQYIDKASLDQAKKKQQKESLFHKKARLIQTIDRKKATIYEQQLFERIKRQIYYVEERFSIHFHDLFSQNFNPTTIQTNQRTVLEKCLQTLLADVRFELLQEIRAVSLRIEAMMRQLMKDLYDNYEQSFKTIDPQMTLPIFPSPLVDTPLFQEGLKKVDFNTLKQSLRLFKNRRQFFEKRESELMKESIFQNILPDVRTYLAEQSQIMLNFYQEAWQQSYEQLITFAIKEIKHYTAHQMAMLSDEININYLQHKVKQLTFLLKEEEL